MEHVVAVALLALVFDGTHIGLTMERPRARLVARLGEGGFVALYFVVASLSWAALIAYYAAHRFDGPAGLALGMTVWRWPLILVIVAGMALLAAGLVAYPTLPSAVFGQPIRTPRGIERITRHPFFAGIALVFLAHMLLASRLVGAVFASSLVVLAIFGGWHQDQKLRARRGDAYAAYLAATSAVPFAAIVTGRQRLVWSELPLGVFAAGVVAAVVLRTFHPSIFAAGGLWVIVSIVGGAVVATLQSLLRARRTAARISESVA